MARASTYIGKQHETGSEARTDPQHRKTSRPEIHTTCPTSSHARRSKSVTYLRTTHDRTRRTHLRRQNDECVCMTGFRPSKRSTQRKGRRRLPSGPPTSTSRIFPDEHFLSFVWELVEREDHGTLVDAHNFFGFLHTAWTKLEHRG